MISKSWFQITAIPNHSVQNTPLSFPHDQEHDKIFSQTAVKWFPYQYAAYLASAPHQWPFLQTLASSGLGADPLHLLFLSKQNFSPITTENTTIPTKMVCHTGTIKTRKTDNLDCTLSRLSNLCCVLHSIPLWAERGSLHSVSSTFAKGQTPWALVSLLIIPVFSSSRIKCP